MAKRFLLAAVGVVLLSAAATATLALNEVGKLVDALGQNRAVKIGSEVLAPTSKGAPETLLLVGDDRRPPPKGNPNGFVVPHSNEMLLVRIDPSKPTISMLSIPRELQVTIHPPGAAPVVNRINVAYTIGGIQLMTETIKRVLGIAVNHVFVVTFPKFKRAVDEMGCVYMTVDRRYHHVNEPGGEQYFEINLQPGYQLLCGQQALQFVANRHEDTSLTRDARDQRFLLEVKAQFGATLFESRERFERILGKAVETDLHGTGPVLDLLELLVQAQGKPVRQVPFHVNLLSSYDTATPRQIRESAQSFLRGTAPVSKSKLGAVVHGATHTAHQGKPAGLTLTPTPAAALAHARSDAPDLPFALEYPRARDGYASAAADTLRLYGIRDQRGREHPIYSIVIDRGPLGEFYDVQGSDWSDPPLLSNPSQTIRVGSRTYGLFYAGEQIRVIAWREGGAAYWIENTLTDSVSPRAMLAIAAQTVPVVGTGAGASSGALAPPSSAAGFNLPPRAVATVGLSWRIGALLGFAGMALVALLALLVFRRQQELNVLREQVARALALEATQRPAIAAAGISRSSIPDPARAARGARDRRRRGIPAAVGLVLVAGAIAIGVLLLRGGSSSSPSTVPVAVFDATGNAGSAHRIAAALRKGRIRVGTVGNINASLGPGTFVLYPPGTNAEARRVARLLPGLSPTVAPIQPQVQSSVGRADEIVVVLD